MHLRSAGVPPAQAASCRSGRPLCRPSLTTVNFSRDWLSQLRLANTRSSRNRAHSSSGDIALTILRLCPHVGTLRVARHIGGKPLTEEESWTKFLRYAGHWSLLGFGYWVVEEKATGDFVERSGLRTTSGISAIAERHPGNRMGSASHTHGRGFATEAVRDAVAWGDVHFAQGKTACIVDPANLASIRGRREMRIPGIPAHDVQGTSR